MHDVLEALQGGGQMTAEQIADQLGRPVDEVANELLVLVKTSQAHMVSAYFVANGSPAVWRYRSIA